MEKIDHFLELYFEGKSSIEQEQELKKYFASAGIADRHRMYQALFEAFEKEKSIVYTENQLEKKKRSYRLRSTWRYITAGVAAALLLMVGIFLYKPTEDYLIVNGQRINNPVLAQETAQVKLMNASSLIEKNLQPIRQLNKIEESLQALENANKQINNIKEKINNIN